MGWSTSSWPRADSDLQPLLTHDAIARYPPGKEGRQAEPVGEVFQFWRVKVTYEAPCQVLPPGSGRESVREANRWEGWWLIRRSSLPRLFDLPRFPLVTDPSFQRGISVGWSLFARLRLGFDRFTHRISPTVPELVEGLFE